MPNAVIYARYSSDKQRETSIEGQLAVCHEYANRMGYNVINEYIDRSKSASKNVERRKAFQQMIADSAKGQFKYIIVYMVDRFARNQYDSVVTLRQLENNGVKLLSAMENLSDTDEGKLILGILELLAEQYSTKLGKRIKDGIKVSLKNGTSLGGPKLLGFKSENKKIVIDENEAQVVRQLFKEYAEGKQIKDIVDDFNSRGFTNARGGKFTKTSFQSILSNEKYIGRHTIYGETYTDRYPALVDEVTFKKAQKRLKTNKLNAGGQKAKINYYLSGKSFCMYCGTSLLGRSGTSHDGSRHGYYTCGKRIREKACNKKHEQKDFLEFTIVDALKNYILTKTSREAVADRVVKFYEETITEGAIKALEAQIKIFKRQMSEVIDLMLLDSKNEPYLEGLKIKSTDIGLQIKHSEEELERLRRAYTIPHTRKDIINYLKVFAYGDPADPAYRKKIIDKLVHTVFVGDTEILCYLNILEDRHIKFDMLPSLRDLEVVLDKEKTEGNSLSSHTSTNGGPSRTRT